MTQIYIDEKGDLVSSNDFGLNPDMFCTCDECHRKRYNMHLKDDKSFAAGKYTLELLNERWHEAMRSRMPWRFSIKVETVKKWLYSLTCHQKIIKNLIPEDAKVLDLACGIGQLATSFDPKNYLGIDIYEPAIEYCRVVNPRHTFESIDLFNASFEENEFDFIIAGGFEISSEIFTAINTWGKNILHFSFSPPTEYTLWNKESNETIKGK